MSNIFDDLLGESRKEADSVNTSNDDKYVMLVELNRNRLIYIADGMKKDLMYMISTFEKMAQFRLMCIDVTEDVDMDVMRRNATALNEKYKELVKV